MPHTKETKKTMQQHTTENHHPVNREANSPQAFRSWLTALIILILLGVLYHDIVPRLFSVLIKDEENAHGLLLLGLAGYLTFRRRIAIKGISREIWLPGLIIMAAGMTVLFAGLLTVEYYLQRASLVILSAGIIGFLCGKKGLRILLFPLILLLLAIPLPAIVVNTLTLPLKTLVSSLSTEMMRAFGIVVLQEGNILQLPGVTLQVVDACSGIRSVFALFVLALVLSLNMQTFVQKAALVVATIPLAMVTNALRIAATGVLASHWNAETAMRFYHGFSGWVVFALSLSLLFILRWLIMVGGERLARKS